MIPTNEIEALRYRAQVALDPLPYQQARLLPKLRQDRPLRFAVMTVRTDYVASLFEEATRDRAGTLRFGHMESDLCMSPHEKVPRKLSCWPAGQIVELCDAVLERRVVGGGNDGPAWLLDPSPLRPMAKVGALDGVRAPSAIIADDPLDP